MSHAHDLHSQTELLKQALTTLRDSSWNAKDLVLRDQLADAMSELEDLRAQLKRTTVALVDSERRLDAMEKAQSRLLEENSNLQKLLLSNTRRPLFWWASASSSASEHVPSLLKAGTLDADLAQRPPLIRGRLHRFLFTVYALITNTLSLALALGLCALSVVFVAAVCLWRFHAMLPHWLPYSLDSSWSLGGGEPWPVLLRRPKAELYLYTPCVAAFIIGIFTMQRLTAIVSLFTADKRVIGWAAGLTGKPAWALAFALRYAASGLAGLAMHQLVVHWGAITRWDGGAGLKLDSQADASSSPSYAVLLLTPWVAAGCEATVYCAVLLLSLFALPKAQRAKLKV